MRLSTGGAHWWLAGADVTDESGYLLAPARRCFAAASSAKRDMLGREASGGRGVVVGQQPGAVHCQRADRKPTKWQSGLAVGVWLSLTPLSVNTSELTTPDFHSTNHPAVWQ